LGKSTICVLVVEDYEPFRQFISKTFQTQSHLRILAEVSDGAEAVQQAQDLQPDLILLDVGLPTLNGIEAARRIRKFSPMSKILFVSENRSLDVTEEALQAGGLGYVIKSDAVRDLLPAIDAVLQGKRFVSGSLSQQVLGIAGMRSSEGVPPTEGNPYLQFAASGLISEFLASIIDATAADFGNVQLFDSMNRALRIVAQRGFENEFLSYFDTVTVKERCACGTAMKNRSRIVVTDVAIDPIFSSDVRGVLLRANVFSVQSTPLIDMSGNFVGMVSTHYGRAGGPSPHMWTRVDDLAARFLAKIKDVTGTTTETQ
jgi:DNA-binding NarL/FixJ family response regulator